MKQIKTLLLAQILFMGIFLSSCMESGDYTPTGGGVVEVLDRYGYPLPLSDIRTLPVQVYR